jgi:hypothetical protein
VTDQDQVPMPDVAEQHATADRARSGELSEEIPEDEGAEADLLDQSRVVEEEQVVERARQPLDVNEADWLEQRIAEPIDDEQR